MSDDGELTGRTLVGGYVVGQKIAAGGMGAVYRATQQGRERPVALKVLHPHLAHNAGILERFRREALAAARLSHVRILSVIDFHLEASPPYMVMPLLEGRSLQDVYRQEGPLHWARMARIASQILEALAVAHGAELVHRDIKPANLYLTSAPKAPDEALLLDFGVAKLKESDEFDRLTRTGELIGTPLFMAPEQARGEAIDGRVDLYALGLVSYALVTGRVPFPDENPAQLLIAIQSMDPKSMLELVPGVDPGFASVIHKSIQKHPARRFQSALEMRAAMLPFAAHAGVAAATPPQASPDQDDMNAPTEIMPPREEPQAPTSRAPQRTAEWQGVMPEQLPPIGVAPASAAPNFAAPPTRGGLQMKHVFILLALLFSLATTAALALGGLYYYVTSRSERPAGGVVAPMPAPPGGQQTTSPP
ncbi:MAG: serine/threonine protein kinase [Deltaproteobacteria bacterium]|nr:serine/threonine protein kinase [Deltaproteobacteria bacterium]